LFIASTTISIGDGAKTSFWHAAWVQGQHPKDMAPAIFDILRKRTRTVNEAFAEHTWIKDINLPAPITVVHLQQFVELWSIMHAIVFWQGTLDKITWRLIESGEYSSRLAYHMQALGSTKMQIFLLGSSYAIMFGRPID
jgi:hypothetical protein